MSLVALCLAMRGMPCVHLLGNTVHVEHYFCGNALEKLAKG